MAAQIRIYATIAGGTEETSYTVLMLKWIGDFHDENNKSNPDPAKLKELKEGIQWVVNEELRIIKQLQAGAQEALAGLENFHGLCEVHDSRLRINATSLDAQLTREGNDIASMQKKIDEAQAELEDYQARIDGSKEIYSFALRFESLTDGVLVYFREQGSHRRTKVHVGVSNPAALLSNLTNCSQLANRNLHRNRACCQGKE